MLVLTPVPTEASSARVAAAPVPTGPACTFQRSGSLWQLGIEAQELTTAIGQLAETLEADDDTRAQALAELEAAYRQQQAKRLTELSRSDASRADALEESLVMVPTHLQPSATRFSFPNHELSSRKSQAVEIDDEECCGEVHRFRRSLAIQTPAGRRKRLLSLAGQGSGARVDQSCLF